LTDKFRFHSDFPDIVKPEVQKRIFPFEYLIPAWCSHVWIGWHEGDRDNQSSVADVTAHYDYRWASINIYASWLHQSEAFKTESLVHELMHISLSPLVDYSRETLKSLLPESEAPLFRASVIEQVRVHCESVTQDLTLIVLNKPSVKGEQPPVISAADEKMKKVWTKTSKRPKKETE
jgi:hypothetical protein